MLRDLYSNWRKRYGEAVKKPTIQTGFAALRIAPCIVTNGTALFAEVKGIRIYQPEAAAYLKES